MNTTVEEEIKNDIDDELVEYGNALNWLDLEGTMKTEMYQKEIRKIRKEFIRSISSILLSSLETVRRETIEETLIKVQTQLDKSKGIKRSNKQFRLQKQEKDKKDKHE
jgi:hypothetical protein